MRSCVPPVHHAGLINLVNCVWGTVHQNEGRGVGFLYMFCRQDSCAQYHRKFCFYCISTSVSFFLLCYAVSFLLLSRFIVVCFKRTCKFHVYVCSYVCVRAFWSAQPVYLCMHSCNYVSASVCWCDNLLHW